MLTTKPRKPLFWPLWNPTVRIHLHYVIGTARTCAFLAKQISHLALQESVKLGTTSRGFVKKSMQFLK
jgi:hypothetical protein